MFEIATRKKFRFPYKGLISVEDLWDLTPTQLDTVYKTLNKEQRDNEAENGLLASSIMMRNQDDLSVKLDIVRYIFNLKQEEITAREQAAENNAKRKHILEILAQKQNAALYNMSEEELQNMLNELG